jgi:hypothetical protein
MDIQTLTAIRQGGADEIINLFQRREVSMRCCVELQERISAQPTLREDLDAEKKVIRTIDNYMRGRLQPVCRINGELILAFPDQCQTQNRMGFAPGDLDTTETSQKFINPSLPGVTIWGVFDKHHEDCEVMPPVSIRHFAEDIDLADMLFLINALIE